MNEGKKKLPTALNEIRDDAILLLNAIIFINYKQVACEVKWNANDQKHFTCFSVACSALS